MKVFVTGGTGFIGKEILKVLNNDDCIDKIYALTRKYESKGEKIEFIKGDIRYKNLGLSRPQLSKIVSCEQIYHLASNISLSLNPAKRNEIIETNIDGTKNLLEIFKYPKKFYYFSSAYAGGRNKLTKERFIRNRPEFRNIYEESKWRAENLVGQYNKKFSLPYIIIRTSIVADENFNEFFSFYNYAKIIRESLKYPHHNKKLKVYGSNKSTLNLIPLKNVVKKFIEIREKNAINRIYNVVNKKSLPTKKFLALITDKYSYSPKIDFSKLSQAERFANRLTKPFWLYAYDSPKWESKISEESDYKWLKRQLE